MRSKVLTAAFMLSASFSISAATAQTYDRHDDRAYRGRDGRYEEHCKRSNGTTGTVAGAVGGGLAGNLLGGGTLGTLAGAGGGALLGRHLDKKHDEAQNRRNGC